MKVTGIRLNPTTPSQLNAEVETVSKSFPLFYALPSEFGGSMQVIADPFIVALLIPSMRLGQTLTVDAPASPKLLRALPKIMTFYHNWDPTYKMVKVETSPGSRETHSPLSKVDALFFTGGIDSFYSLTKLTEQNSEHDFTHLIFVHGFDIKLNDSLLFEKTHAALKEIASRYEKKLVIVKTNLRSVTDEYVSWANCCGGGMASAALSFNGFFRQIYISSDLGPNERNLPLAIHPDLDPLWSTETTNFVHYLDGVGRVQKARALADNQIAQKHLRVCWENRNGAYNCGRCSKCVRTMLALHLAGALSKFNFPTALTPELVSALNYDPDPSVILHTQQIIHELQQRGENQLAKALSKATKKPLTG
ncbi:MAG TPA: hypothetical protein VJZ32_03220 [Candidatus Bathyarchaeia archaeon]|nr:hypothetical protein [Candidatus Bathyarchaeia archaeon]